MSEDALGCGHCLVVKLLVSETRGQRFEPGSRRVDFRDWLSIAV